MHRVQIIFFIVSVIININSSLDDLVDNEILRSEAVIRSTFNKLFTTLKLKRDNPRLSEYLIINKYFTSLTLQDCDTLNDIAKTAKANAGNNNGTVDFITAINGVLNDDKRISVNNKISREVSIDENADQVSQIIETFLNRLRHAKELYDVNNYIHINENILKVIKEANIGNATRNDRKDNYLDNDTISTEIDFWEPSGRRVYKGARTKIKYYPFVASIHIFNNFQCAGSIIKSDLIITASSCLQLAWNNRFYRENPAFLSVRVGSSFYSGGGEVIPALEVYFHPDYEPKTLRHNICILRVVRKIKFSRRARQKVRKIDIDRHHSNLPYNTPGITIVGWGAKGQSNVVRDPWQNIISFDELDVYSLKDCQDVYSKEYVTRQNFCAGFISKGGGACNRDIGGPGIDGGILMGVVSFGSPVCGAADAPTVFTKLGYYSDWIDTIMNQNVPVSKKKTTLKPPRSPYLPIRHTTPTTTTFKLAPLSGSKMKPIPIYEIDNVLRMFDDDLFKEFLKTMFNSKEVAEYEEVFKEVKHDVKVKGKKESELHTAVTEDVEDITSGLDYYAEPVTKLISFEVESQETTDRNKYTVLDDSKQLYGNRGIKSNIAEVINDIDLKKIIEEESIAAHKENNLKGITEAMGFDFVDSRQDASHDQKNESVLTLLYLSDQEQNKKINLEANSNEEYNDNGLSIAADTFHDLTRSEGKQFNVLPEKELYEILSEVIDDEMRHNKTFV